MAKGEDSRIRKQNKAIRKRMRKDAPVSARIAAVIAAKKRRKSGNRRLCEGMCFSAPTLEDPFNDRHNMKNDDKKRRKQHVGEENHFEKSKDHEKFLPNRKVGGDRSSENLKKTRLSANIQNKSASAPSHAAEENNAVDEMLVSKTTLVESGRGTSPQGRLRTNFNSVPKFLILCLRAIQKAWRADGSVEQTLLSSIWGFEFWKACSEGLNVLGINGDCSSKEQVAWLASTAADIVAKREKEGASVENPFLLFLVPSQERAREVHSMCKPLKDLGIHAVSIHPGASLHHQVHGLKCCEPEFLICTPGRLLELISLKALDISHVSLLVIDGLDHFVSSYTITDVVSVRKLIEGDPQTVIFGGNYGKSCIVAAQSLLRTPVKRLVSDDSVISQCICILQSVYLCTSEDEKISKVIQLLEEEPANKLFAQRCCYVVAAAGDDHALVTSLRHKGYTVSVYNKSKHKTSDNAMEFSDKAVSVLVISQEQILDMYIGELETIVLFDFPTSVDEYLQVLSRMARHSVHGALHSFFGEEDSALAQPLIKVLEECQQLVPDLLRQMASVSHKRV